MVNLKPQDILFLLKLVALGNSAWSFKSLSNDMGMSSSEVHAAARRAITAGLAVEQGAQIKPDIKNLEEFLLYGIQYVFVPERGGLIDGMPTGIAAQPLNASIKRDGAPPPVWPYAGGLVRGESFSPLYRSAPIAAKNDPGLYELLALVDAIRGGPSRERDRAKNELKKRLSIADKRAQNTMNPDKNILVIGETLKVSRSALKQLAQQYHIKRLVLFGSAARGELKLDSDIDLIAEFDRDKAPSLGGLVKIQDAFVHLFGGRRVDIATPNILNNPYRRRAIEREMKELYAA
jgi:predicted nucleotidyltransferase